MARLISFSGGRSSAMMTKILIDNGLKDDDFIVFADTGMERPETHDFINACELHWGVQINRLKRTDTANPFETLIREKRLLPNLKKRVCTSELKIVPMQNFMVRKGFSVYENIIGIRFDEPNRWAKLNLRNEENEAEYDKWLVSKRKNKKKICIYAENKMPLFDLRITVSDVRNFWNTQKFDLQLESYEGNCDLCFLKGKRKIVQLIRENPESADWWIEMEKFVTQSMKEINIKRKENGKTPLKGIGSFRLEYTYKQLKDLALNQVLMDFDEFVDNEIQCVCNID